MAHTEAVYLLVRLNVKPRFAADEVRLGLYFLHLAQNSVQCVLDGGELFMDEIVCAQAQAQAQAQTAHQAMGCLRTDRRHP